MYEKILVPLDGSKLAECVLPHVESIARGCGVQNVIFLRVVEPVNVQIGGDDGYAFTVEQWKQMEAGARIAAESYINELAGRVKYDGVNVQPKILAGGQAADIIADYATKNGIELIAIASHGRSGVSRWVWGSVADRVLRSACIPVLVVRAPGCVPGV